MKLFKSSVGIKFSLKEISEENECNTLIWSIIKNWLMKQSSFWEAVSQSAGQETSIS